MTDLTQSLNEKSHSPTFYGGGLPGDPVHAPGNDVEALRQRVRDIMIAELKSWMYAPASPPLGLGDWVFLHPRQGDGIFAFEKLLLVSGGRLTGAAWSAYPRRY